MYICILMQNKLVKMKQKVEKYTFYLFVAILGIMSSFLGCIYMATILTVS